MLLALVDSLRCPAAHEESALVLSVAEWKGPRVSRGTLGCPVCHARYPVEGGMVDFTSGAGRGSQGAGGDAPDEFRLAAQLALSEAGGFVLLTGRYSTCHDVLSEMSGVVCLLVDAARTMSPAAVNLQLAERLPLIDGALRAAAVDGPRTNNAFLAEVARCLRAGGRLVVPRVARIPAGVRLLAEDERESVSEAVTSPPIVPLHRPSR